MRILLAVGRSGSGGGGDLNPVSDGAEVAAVLANGPCKCDEPTGALFLL